MSKRILLVGAGADIGSNLVALSSSHEFQYPITDIVTNTIYSSGTDSDRRSSLDELCFRIMLAQPSLYWDVKPNPKTGCIEIGSYSVRVHFQDFLDDLSHLGHFDLAILATSRTHIRNRECLDHLESVADVVLGAAENSELPALYPALVQTSSESYTSATTHTNGLAHGSYAIGSCQCAGWTSGLRVIEQYCNNTVSVLKEKLVHAEVDIVHPDTASSNFGTNHIGARSEDPRGNLRPGFSQVDESMKRFHPASTRNAVSLRVLTSPPGYQVQRFYLDFNEIDRSEILDAAHQVETNDRRNLHVAPTPVGSKAYSAASVSTTLIGTSDHLTVVRVGELLQVTLQAYVHNTLGYSGTILGAVEKCLDGGPITTINPRTSQDKDLRK